MIEFKRSNARIWRFFLFLNAIVIIMDLLIKVSILSWYTFLFASIFNIAYILNIISDPIKIIINQETLSLEINYLFPKKTHKILIKTIEFSFDYVRLPRGQKVKALRLMQEGRIILELVAETSGYSDTELNQFFEKLKELKNL